MVRETERIGEIGRRQWISNRIGPDDCDRPLLRRPQVHADPFDLSPPANVSQHAAVPTANIQDAAHRQWIAADRPHDASGVSEESVEAREVPVRPRDHRIGEQFRL